MSADHPPERRSHGGTDQPAKRRAACDECRMKKLKCSGDQPACARCMRENIACVYSVQKQMGRPRKRVRSDTEGDKIACARAMEKPLYEQTDDTSGYEHAVMDRVNAHDIAKSASYQTWNLPTVNDWAPGDVPLESSLPGLTPDTSSNSPLLLQLPPELQQNSPRNTSSQTLVDSLSNDVQLGVDLNLLPGMPPCACLSTLYLSLNNLQQMAQPYQFPFSLYPLREAMSTANAVLQCQECPQKFLTGMQNTQLMGTLLVSIAERFGKVLDAITTEAVRADMLSEMKKFRLADLNTATSHLHTGGLGCAAAFSIDLSPDEWRSMSKKVVRAEVYGPHAGTRQSSSIASDDSMLLHSHSQHDSQACQNFSNTEHASCVYLMGVINQMLRRQERWHKNVPPDDFPLDREGNLVGGMRSDSGDHLCMKMPAYAARLAQAFDWS